ncbi:flavoprotein [Streptomyces erythrochromogenes]|uniref:flavoprotein n=1 Tax=Streptomyces erythrochromogenes TaxID=285574 RepID=UPI00343F8074
MPEPEGRHSPLDATPLPRLLVCVTGAAAVFSLPHYLIALRAQIRCTVTVVMSSSAARFITPAAVRHLADEVIDASNPEEAFASGHMKLTMEADLILVLPCSAATLSAAAHGLAHELIPAVVLASPQPVLFFPSMHSVMWRKAALQRNVHQLRADGHEVIEPTLRKAYELADRSVEEHPALITPAAFVRLVRERLATPARRPAPTGGQQQCDR